MPRRWREAMQRAKSGKIAFLDHNWKGARVLKVLCSDRERLIEWGEKHGLKARYIHDTRIPHFDLRGEYRERLLDELGEKGATALTDGG